MATPIVGFAAYSGTGKTTLIERLITRLGELGVRVGVVKHDAHGFEIDHEGKDSWRFTQAGSEATVISSAQRTALVERRARTLEECIAMIREVDLILVEGYKGADIPRIGISRRATGKGFTAPVDRFIAVVTDEETETGDVPRFSLNDIEGIAAFIVKRMLPQRTDAAQPDGRTIETETTERMSANMTDVTGAAKADFTHFDEQGRARMVDVGEKPINRRTATAAGRVLVSQSTLALIRSGGMKKGDVLTTAQIAGVMGAKRTPDVIPMCHPILIDGIDLKLWLDEAHSAVEIRATVSCDGRTGVEMEALTAVSVAALTVYDMCKAVQKDMVIDGIRLLAKTGGVHGDFVRTE